MEYINEDSTYIVTVTFKDETGAAVVPFQAWYSLFCKSTGTEILAEIVIAAPASSTDIMVTVLQNRIVNKANTEEEKLLTVRFTYSGGTKQGTAEYNYRVLNLSRIR